MNSVYLMITKILGHEEIFYAEFNRNYDNLSIVVTLENVSRALKKSMEYLIIKKINYV